MAAAFDGGLVSSDGGLVLLRGAERRLGLAEALAGCIRDRRNQAQVVHWLSAMLRFRMLAIACGYEDADDCDALRAGPTVQAGLRESAGERPVGVQDTPVDGQIPSHSLPGLLNRHRVARFRKAPDPPRPVLLIGAPFLAGDASPPQQSSQRQAVLRDHPSVLPRAPTALPPASAALSYRYVRVNLQDVDLGFAGRRGERDPIHRRIAALSPGDPLETRITEQGRWELLDAAGSIVGRLAGSFEPPPGMRCRSAEVMAVVGWGREASEPQYRDSIRCDAWEVVVPELVFESSAQNPG